MCRIFVFLKKKNEVFSPKHRPTSFLVPLPIHPSPFLPQSPPESKRGKLLPPQSLRPPSHQRLDASQEAAPTLAAPQPQAPLSSTPRSREARKEGDEETMDSSSGGGGAQIKGMATHGGRYVLYNVYGNLFEVSSKYAPPIRPIGRGAYGIVWCVPSPLPLYSFLSPRWWWQIELLSLRVQVWCGCDGLLGKNLWRDESHCRRVCSFAVARRCAYVVNILGGCSLVSARLSTRRQGRRLRSRRLAMRSTTTSTPSGR